MDNRIVVINVGSTSNKVAVFEGDKEIWRKSQPFDSQGYPRTDLRKQFSARKQAVMDLLHEHDEDMGEFSVIVSRGCGLGPVDAGIYLLCSQLIEDAYKDIHPSVVGCDIALYLGKEYHIPAIQVDPTVVDQLSNRARFSGLAGIDRRSGFHALNQRAIAQYHCMQTGLDYEECNLVVVHLGGGVSVGAHEQGRIVDVNYAGGGEGPFSMERVGSFQGLKLIDLCYSGEFTQEEMIQSFCEKGGVFSYLGTKDGEEIGSRIAAGDTFAEEVIQAFAYRIAKEIGSLVAALKGKVEAVLLTGGLAYWEYLTALIHDYVGTLAPVYLYPGEREMEALAAGALRMLQGKEEAQVYPYLPSR